MAMFEEYRGVWSAMYVAHAAAVLVVENIAVE